MICTVPGCNSTSPYKARGMCRTHYGQWQRGEEPHPIKERAPIHCTFEGCTRPHNALGLCTTHGRQRKLGQDLRPARVRDVTVRDEAGRKLCIRCQSWLAEGAFKPAPHTRDQLRVWCNICVITRRYTGMTRHDYEAMLAGQDGVCAICLGTSADGKALHIDHDHACCPENGKSCGKCVRGLLCDRCNKAIGLLGDNTQNLARAATYISTRRAAA